jgi:hypothetical protein
MDAYALAEQKFELQRKAFIYGDIKSEMLTAFRNSAHAVIYMEDDEGAHYVNLDPKALPIYDVVMDSSFKVGDNFKCQIRENSKERWFQIKYDRTFINLREPNNHFKREVDGREFFIFTSLTNITIIMLSPSVPDLMTMRKVLTKMSNSIVGFDQHGSVYVKRGVK